MSPTPQTPNPDPNGEIEICLDDDCEKRINIRGSWKFWLLLLASIEVALWITGFSVWGGDIIKNLAGVT